ncbi:NADP-dependent 3-hydroxy acid dehydrogenase YdfG [Actinocorallia herbida]|uniref:NADP-dependent 3-hydroxy acid dehydrogenase YdfG n=1 Tax=Actinocorallia herbida TaxID=58109 RepID=A0A3N1D373_9ACTN|nr:SDR family NAD(P)-dependent oxidoreductase [Actinocorallia herbida]ROO87993.1 NADP-dependent 3-hydroxy acid dehydrogenase YdfG [Actinocorallia herbida]
MSTKTMVVIGAGPGIGLAVARRWGGEGYRIALVARQAERLSGFVDRLGAEGVEAAAFPTDVTDRAALAATLTEIKKRFGRIDALYFGPPATSGTMVAPRDFTVKNTSIMLDLVTAAVAAVEFVLPELLERREGALLFCVPMSAVEPVLFSANYAMACAALRNYAQSLFVDVHAEGVSVGVVTIAGLVVEGDSERSKSLAATARRPGDRAWDEYRAFHEDLAAHVTSGEVADAFWRLAADSTEVEEILGNPEICARLRAQALAGTPAT